MSADNPGPLSRRFSFELQDQTTVFVDELHNFIHRYCHDYPPLDLNSAITTLVILREQPCAASYDHTSQEL